MTRSRAKFRGSRGGSSAWAIRDRWPGRRGWKNWSAPGRNWGLLDDRIHGKKPKHDFDSYLSRMYFDTGGHFGEMTAVKAALLNIPVANLMFGTDYPQEIRGQDKVKAFIEGLRALDLPQED